MPDLERRSRRRYPIQLSLRYRSANETGPLAGTGQTLNVSSGGLLIASSQSVKQGARLQLNVDWPWLLDDVTPLQLVAETRVVRASKTDFAVMVERYQFRTSKR